MTLPAIVIPKLSKLIPMLATDRDGELVAAVRAIGRALQSVGADFHDLARALDQPPRVVERIVEKTVWRDRPAPAKPTDTVPETWPELAQWLQKRAAKLTPKEADFVADMAARLWGSEEPTERQGAWMKSIYAKLRRTEPTP